MQITSKVNFLCDFKKHKACECSGGNDVEKCLPGKLSTDKIPVSAWQANKLSFGSFKISTDEFKAKMQEKVDKILAGTYQRAKVSKEELFEQRTEIVKNIKGPVALECQAVSGETFAELNKDFARVKNTADLYKLLNDPRIPDNEPMVIRDISSENYNQFMSEVERGNATNDVQQATAAVESALKDMKEKDIEIPEFNIKVSRKSLAIALIDHVSAGLPYEPMSLLASPYFSFKSGDELSVEVIKPVYER